MATQNNVHVSDELLAELQAKAQTEGKTVDELAEEALRKGLDERAWQDLLAYGLQTGRESGFTVADVPEVVKNRRRINARSKGAECSASPSIPTFTCPLSNLAASVRVFSAWPAPGCSASTFRTRFWMNSSPCCVTTSRGRVQAALRKRTACQARKSRDPQRQRIVPSRKTRATTASCNARWKPGRSSSSQAIRIC